MCQPPVFVYQIYIRSNYVCMLQRSLYGLKEAPNAYTNIYVAIKTILIVAYFVVYVDDLLFNGNSFNFHLGVELLPISKCIFLSQWHYIYPRYTSNRKHDWYIPNLCVLLFLPHQTLVLYYSLLCCTKLWCLDPYTVTIINWLYLLLISHCFLWYWLEIHRCLYCLSWSKCSFVVLQETIYDSSILYKLKDEYRTIGLTTT